MQILVTGGTGFIGSNLVNELVDHHHVYITGTSSEVNINDKVIDIFSLDSVPDLNFDIVFHQAACNDTISADVDGMYEINIDKSMKLVEQAYRNGCRKFVFASTTAVYGNSPAPYLENKTKTKPLNCYASSKAILECRLCGFWNTHQDMDIVGLRYCNVYGMNEDHKGRRMSMISHIINDVEQNRNPKLFKWGEQKRDWIYVRDVVRANLAATKFKGFDIFNCGSGQAASFNQLLEIIGAAMGKKIEPDYVENPYQETYQNYTECNMDKIKEALEFEPLYNVFTGIKEYITLRQLSKPLAVEQPV